MKRVLFTGCVLLCAMLSACGQKDAATTGIVFQRGHGSAWGNQFYIEVYADRIAAIHYFPEGASEQVVRENIPITAQQWQALMDVLQTMELKEKSTWKEALFGGSKQDGGEFRELTLIRETEKGTVRTRCQWSQSEQAAALEALLEQFAENLKEDSAG